MPEHPKQEQGPKLPDLASWQADNLRLTAFLSPRASVSEQSWWETILKEPAEKVTSHPKGGVRQEEGPFEKGRVVLQIQPARIDWHYYPSDGEEINPFGILGPVPDVVAPFVDFGCRWLEIAPPIARLAYGIIVSLPQKSREEGYGQLGRYVPVKIDSVGSSDFSYQINRPRPSKSGVADLRINRLSRWSCMIRKEGQLAISLGEKGSAFHSARESHACRIELDINTDPNYPTDLPAEKTPSIFRELVELANEIVTNGDTP